METIKLNPKFLLKIECPECKKEQEHIVIFSMLELDIEQHFNLFALGFNPPNTKIALRCMLTCSNCNTPFKIEFSNSGLLSYSQPGISLDHSTK